MKMDRTNPTAWLEHHGDYLYRYALSRLRRSEAAEDVVQETFVGALKNRDQFAGNSSERTWLVAILKRKIVDHLRRKQRERPVSELASEENWADDLFDDHGHWKRRPAAWTRGPGAALDREEFWAAFRACLDKLPERMADAFTLREVEGLDGREVCNALDVSANNLWVMLHRARLRLWKCLGSNWFNVKE
jgi:RNA polymerase sigma-70 factor (TIGR02943 family)